MKKTMSPPRESLSYLNGGTYLSILNCVCGKDESSFIPETIMLSFTIVDNISNLFLMELMFFTIVDNISSLFLTELMFLCTMRTLFTSFIRIFFKISGGPSSQLVSIVLKVSVDYIGFKSKSHFG